MMHRLMVVLSTALLMAGSASAEVTEQQQRILDALDAWVQGEYDNREQSEADLASDIAPEKMHRLMFQTFAGVEVDGFDELLIYQQSSIDGSTNPDTVFRAGLLRFVAGERADTIRQQELNFKDIPRWVNAHLEPGKLAGLTMDDVIHDPGCDFFLTLNTEGDRITGTLPERSCKIENPGTQSTMYADDLIVVTAEEYQFRGRFVNEEGQVVWGTESEELNRLVRRSGN